MAFSWPWWRWPCSGPVGRTVDLAVGALGRLTAPLGLPAEALPLLRLLSGSGSYVVLASLLGDPGIGPDSYTGFLISILRVAPKPPFMYWRSTSARCRCAASAMP
jgi:hypothetical protein